MKTWICPTCEKKIPLTWLPPIRSQIRCQCGLVVEHNKSSFVQNWYFWSLGAGFALSLLLVLILNQTNDAFGVKGSWMALLPLAILSMMGATAASILGFLAGGALALMLIPKPGGSIYPSVVEAVVTEDGGLAAKECQYLRNYRCSICGFVGPLEPTSELKDALCPQCNSLCYPE